MPPATLWPNSPAAEPWAGVNNPWNDSARDWWDTLTMSVEQFLLNFAPERHVYRVAELSRIVREKLEREFGDIWVEGEISNFRPSPSGILYFTLKDDAAQLRCVCFRTQARYLKFRPEDGLSVLVRGKISVYEARGEYQLYVEYMEPQGLGALQFAF